MKTFQSILLLAAITFLSGCGHGGPYTLQDDGTGVEVTFPGKPQTDATKSNNGQTVRMAAYSGDSMQLNLSLRQTEYELTDELFETMKQAALQGFTDQGFSTTSLRDTTFNGARAFYAVCTHGDELMKMYHSFHPNFIVTIASNSNKNGSFNQQTLDFFNSFKIRE